MNAVHIFVPGFTIYTLHPEVVRLNYWSTLSNSLSVAIVLVSISHCLLYLKKIIGFCAKDLRLLAVW
ncbi:MAG: hypothetical protein ABI741_07130 [Ferruginibacter sp.]